MRADISPKSLNKVFYVNNKITGKDLKTFKISSIRKLISSLNKNLNVNAQPNERKYKNLFHGQTQRLAMERNRNFGPDF